MASKRSILLIRFVSGMFCLSKPHRLFLPSVYQGTLIANSLSLKARFPDVKDADLKEMDCQISELSTEVQSLTQGCKQLDSGELCRSLQGHLVARSSLREMLLQPLSNQAFLLRCGWKAMLSVFVCNLRGQNWRNSPALWQQRNLCLRSGSWKRSVQGTEPAWRRSSRPQIMWHQKREKRLGTQVVSQPYYRRGRRFSFCLMKETSDILICRCTKSGRCTWKSGERGRDW